MSKANAIFLAVLASTALISCGGGGADEAITVGGSLFTNAPSTVALDPGMESTYRVNGGSPLYSASSGNTNVVRVGVVGGQLTLAGVAPGSTTVSVVDTLGSKVTFAVVVGGQGVAGGPLFTNAPSAVVLDPSASATYSLSGGSAPYSAVSSNTNVVTAAVTTGGLTLRAVAPGTASVAVTDAQGARTNIGVTVSAQGAANPISLTPASLSVGNCTWRIPFIFSGGVAPYTVLTTDNFNVPVSSPLPMGDGRSYFFADVHYSSTAGSVPLLVPQTLTVLDSGSRTATVALLTNTMPGPCPTNPLLTISPETANLRVSEILSYQVNGGPSPASTPSVRFSDALVAEVVGVSPTSVQVRGLQVGWTLMTITAADQQMASVVIRVLPQ